MRIILGSSSPWRKQVLENMSYEFEVMSPDINEKAIRNLNPSVLTLALARAKSEALGPKIKGPAILITSDQVVVCDGQIREKPVDTEQCLEFLDSYRRHNAKTVTSVMVYNTVTRHDAAAVDEATIFFHKNRLTDEAIQKLITDPIVSVCAGAIAAGYPVFDEYVACIHGELDSVMGLPRQLTDELIRTVSE